MENATSPARSVDVAATSALQTLSNVRAPGVGQSKTCGAKCIPLSACCTTGTEGCGACKLCENAQCVAEGDCTDGDTRTVACGNCSLGRQKQTCVSCHWVNSGTCTGAGDCKKDDQRMTGACGRCGQTQEVCSASCTWEAKACLGEKGTCIPGAKTVTKCGNCDLNERIDTCSSDCNWLAGDCKGPEECKAGDEKEGICAVNECIKTRVTCNGCRWRNECFGAPIGCTPFKERETQSTCNFTCALDKGTQHQVCSTSCVWKDEGACYCKLE
jgi:hypothetical protein